MEVTLEVALELDGKNGGVLYNYGSFVVIFQCIREAFSYPRQHNL